MSTAKDTNLDNHSTILKANAVRDAVNQLMGTSIALCTMLRRQKVLLVSVPSKIQRGKKLGKLIPLVPTTKKMPLSVYQKKVPIVGVIEHLVPLWF